MWRTLACLRVLEPYHLPEAARLYVELVEITEDTHPAVVGRCPDVAAVRSELAAFLRVMGVEPAVSR